MPPAQIKQIKTIFVEVSEMAAAQRSAYLDQACAGNAALRAEVEALLAAADKAGEFLASPTHDSSAVADQAPNHPGREAPGAIIGPYKLLELIGEGGFGSVFMAEQEQPIRRKVALKIIKLGMDTRQVIARFEAERQALAMMDHPNIARVFDAGATQTGRPYFVMELVRGVPITEYCDDQKLTTHQRVELFIQVCQAIQHAHQKGVIHRDIKPNNVLVTMHDDKPVPKIIDFGIAKATTQRLTEKTLITEFRQFVGTPAYMSPEQAQMNELDIDTRSDIYSLGVLLYELLTGATPFDQKQLRAAAYEEIRRIIREVDPPKPSDRISTLGDALPAIAAQRGTAPSKLAPGMRGDLDWIVMKCLEKDRTRRYETANALARDGQRYLSDEVVDASPPSATYRLRRFIRQYRRALSITAVVALLLTVTTVLSIREALRARRAEVAAVTAEGVANTEAAKSRQVANFLETVLQGVGPVVAMGRDTTVLREILERTRQRLDTELLDQPAVRAELYSTIAVTYFAMGDSIDDITLERKALALRRSVFKGDNPEVALSLTRLANALQETDEAVVLAKEALGIKQRLSPGDSREIAEAMTGVGQNLRQVNQYSQAEQYLRQALDMRRRLGDGSDGPGLADAGRLHQPSEAILPDPPNAAYARNLHELGMAVWYQGRRAEGLQLTRQCVDMQRKFLPPYHRSFIYSLRDLAFELQSEGDLSEAGAAAHESFAIANRVLSENAHTRLDSMGLLVGIDSDFGNFTQAEDLARQRFKTTQAFLATADPKLAQIYWDAEPATSLAKVLFNEQKYKEAEALYQQGLDMNRRTSPPDKEAIAWNLSGLGNLLSAEGKYDRAESSLREGLDLARTIPVHGDYEVAWCMTCLANSLSDQGKYSEADELYRGALQVFRASIPSGNPGREWASTCFANSLLKEKDFTGSESFFREALVNERANEQGQTLQTRLTAQGLANLLTATGRIAEAAALRNEFSLSAPATQPATTPLLSAVPLPAFNHCN
jgi:eukaryotic-like serine/threonine-protein kinase